MRCQLNILNHFRIPLKTTPAKPPVLPQGRSRQKMVADIMKTSVKTRSQSVPASARPPVPVRPPFTSFSTAPPTPGSIKKGMSFDSRR